MLNSFSHLGAQKKSSNFVEILVGKEKRWENTFLKGVCQKNLILIFSLKKISSDSITFEAF